MNKDEFVKGMNYIAPEIVEEYVAKKEMYHGRKTGIFLRIGAIAACVVLAASTFFTAVHRNNPDNPTKENPNQNVQAEFNGLCYYGSESSSIMPGTMALCLNTYGVSVTAEFKDVLPDTYTFFDDWRQTEYRLIKLKTQKVLSGKKIPEEFYYLIPVDFMTDYSLYDRFVIKDMAQFTYEYSVLYNKTQGKAEQFTTVIFGNHSSVSIGGNFTAYNILGIYDGRLWNSTDAWKEATENSTAPVTLEQAEERVKERAGESEYIQNMYVHSLKKITGKAAEVLEQIKSFENGIYVPTNGSSILYLGPEVQFHARKYINGFATNDTVSVWEKSWNRGDEDVYEFSKAHFDESDINTLPDLPTAFSRVCRAVENGDITPPHFNNGETVKRTLNGAFAWYAKTESGVIGIVRVTWLFITESYKDYYDDAYCIVLYGSDGYEIIDRDALLARLGEYENAFIFTGEYDENGKVRKEYFCY